MISFILPVYNGERFVKRCIDSILIQDEIHELIVINDGSTDGTANILDAYLSHKNVKIINIENKGVSHARNYGVSFASGIYVRFVDADDYLPEKSSEVFLDHFNEDVCIVIGSSSHFSERDIFLKSYRHVNDVNDIDGSVNKILEQRNSFGVCDKLFLLSVIKENNIKFDENIYNFEDFLFLITYLKSVNIASRTRVVYLDSIIYNYTESNDSATRSTLNAKQLSFYKSFREVDLLLNNGNKDNFLLTRLHISVRYYLRAQKERVVYTSIDIENSILEDIRNLSIELISRPRLWNRFTVVYLFVSFTPKWILKSLRAIK